MTDLIRHRLLGLFVVLALVAGACGGDGGEGGDDEARPDDGGDENGETVDPDTCPVDALDDASGPVEITFWHAMTDVNAEELETMVSDYNAAQDRVRVRLVFTGSYTETLERYRTAARSGENTPDVVQLEETAIQQMIDSQTAVPAQACIEASSYDTSDHLPIVLEEFTVEDVLWPMPFNVSTPILYYSTERFGAAGLDPDDPPGTLDELLEASRTIVESGVTPNAFSLETQAWYIEQWFNMAGEPVVNNSNGRDGRATEALLDSPTGTDIFEFVTTMKDEGLILDVGRNPSGTDHLFAIVDRVSMTIATSAALGGVYDVLEQQPELEASIGLGVGGLPGPTGSGVVPGGAALWMVDGDDPERIAATWDWVTWLNEPEQQARWHAATGYIPIRMTASEAPEVQELWAERPGFEVAFRQVAESANETGGPVIGAYLDFRDAIVTALERILQEGAEVPDALAQLDQEATEAIQAYNELVGG